MAAQPGRENPPGTLKRRERNDPDARVLFEPAFRADVPPDRLDKLLELELEDRRGAGLPPERALELRDERELDRDDDFDFPLLGNAASSPAIKTRFPLIKELPR